MELLFHGTDEFGKLKSILQNGFYPSYAKEKFAGRDQKILMVSFNFMPIQESLKEKAYGIYKVGVNLEWAKKNNIHPVHYTFESSYFEKAVVDLIEIGIAGEMLETMIDTLNKGVPVVVPPNSALEKFRTIAASGLTKDQGNNIHVITESVVESAFLIHFFTKNYQVQLENGDTHIAFFDREWRYIPRKGLGHPLLLFKESFGEESEDYKYWESKPKPHGKEIPLKIEVEDIKFIMVENENQLPELQDCLGERFGRDKIKQLIGKGELQLTCFQG